MRGFTMPPSILWHFIKLFSQSRMWYVVRRKLQLTTMGQWEGLVTYTDNNLYTLFTPPPKQKGGSINVNYLESKRLLRDPVARCPAGRTQSSSKRKLRDES